MHMGEELFKPPPIFRPDLRRQGLLQPGTVVYRLCVGEATGRCGKEVEEGGDLGGGWGFMASWRQHQRWHRVAFAALSDFAVWICFAIGWCQRCEAGQARGWHGGVREWIESKGWED